MKQVIMFLKISWAIIKACFTRPGRYSIVIPDYDTMTVRIEPQ